MPREVAADELRVFLIVVTCMRPGSNQRHGAAQDVEKLRQFVEARFAKKSPNAGHAGIITSGLCVTVGADRLMPHCSELPDPEDLVHEAISLLPEQCRAFA